jgi:hypothetical protein
MAVKKINRTSNQFFFTLGKITFVLLILSLEIMVILTSYFLIYKFESYYDGNSKGNGISYEDNRTP